MTDQIIVLILILIIWGRGSISSPVRSPALNFSYRLSVSSHDPSPRRRVIELGGVHYRLHKAPGTTCVVFFEDSARSPRESLEDQGQFFHVTGIHALHLPRKIQF
jgi:hypothetical protein